MSGKISEVVRGAKRKILTIKILADGKQKFADFGKQDVDKMSGEEVNQHLLSSGCWPFIKQRPYDVIANPNQAPKSIFISAYASAPLAASYDYTLAGIYL